MILQKNSKIKIESLNELNAFSTNTKQIVLDYLKIEKDYRYALREMSAKLENIDDYCQATYDHNPIHHIESRVKTPISIIEKMERRGYEMNFESLQKNVYDIAGIRVICNYINDIYQIITLLEAQKDIKVRLKKDYITNPKSTGYRSFHIVFDLEMYIGNDVKYVPVEVQFRTIAMDMWSTLEYELRYKSKNQLSDDDKMRLKSHSEELYKIDLDMQRIYISATATKEPEYND